MAASWKDDGGLSYVVEAIRPADNKRAIFGPFETEDAADAWRTTRERRAGDWELSTQAVSRPGAFGLLAGVEEPPRRRAR